MNNQNNIKADIAVFPVGSVYYGKNVIYKNIDGSGLLKKTSHNLPGLYASLSTNEENDYIDLALDGTVITQPRQLQNFILTPTFKFSDYPNLDTVNINCYLTGTYSEYNNDTKFYFFYEIEYMYSKGIFTKRTENYTNTQSNIIQKLYNLNVKSLPDTSLHFSITNLFNNTVTWHLKAKFS